MEVCLGGLPRGSAGGLPRESAEGLHRGSAWGRGLPGGGLPMGSVWEWSTQPPPFCEQTDRGKNIAFPCGG